MKILLTILSAILVATVLAAYPSPKKTLKLFWAAALAGDIETAASYAAEEGDLQHSKNSAGTSFLNYDGTKVDLTDKERIFKRQLKLEKILDSDSESLRAGFIIETLDADNVKNNFIVCLGKAENSIGWRVFKVFNATDKKISKVCFE